MRYINLAEITLERLLNNALLIMLINNDVQIVISNNNLNDLHKTEFYVNTNLRWYVSESFSVK